MSNNNNNRSLLKTYARFSGLGFQIGLFFLAGIYGGKYLDTRLDTKPVFLVIGATLGMIGGFFGLFRMIMPGKKESDDDPINKPR